jgi:diaminohydroxyphosphoribosylaminopyrimidine deaminase/5-amino-6-(5-phosphoribosylamino)uracil reductase
MKSMGKIMGLKDDEKFMKRALELSCKGRPAPNPYVGAVIVKNGEIIGEGFHAKCGHEHAEIAAIKNAYEKFGGEAKEKLKGSAIFVTLEPCNHFGKTPPCTDAIIKEKISRVVYAMKDENPKVKGGGSRRLQEAGIEVFGGLLEEEARAVNAAYLKHIKTGLPLVTLKLATSLDGRTATKTGDSKWISGEKSRLIVHNMRDKAGAVMVGIGTILADNPHLTCRIEGGHDPLRIIVDGKLRIPPDANVLFDKNVVIGCMDNVSPDKKNKLLDRKIRLIECPAKSEVKFDLKFLLEQVGKMGINHVMCEGGADLAAELIRLGLADEIVLFVAPKIIGGEKTGIFGGMGVVGIEDAKEVEITMQNIVL